MGKLSKQEIKLQEQVNEVWSKPNLTIDDIDFVYEFYNPMADVEVSTKGIFHTPLDLCQDFALMTHKSGQHILDLCGGTGKLSYRLINMSYYQTPIKSITIIEQCPHFVDMGKRLLGSLSGYNEHIKYEGAEPIQINFVCGSMYDKDLLDSLSSTLPNGKWDITVSNPPYGKCSPQEKIEASWLNYKGERELMALEIANRYSNRAYFIIPPMSCEFQYSGRPYYDRRSSTKIERFRKANPDMFFYMESMSIDCEVYIDQWQGTKINVECAEISFDKSEYK